MTRGIKPKDLIEVIEETVANVTGNGWQVRLTVTPGAIFRVYKINETEQTLAIRIREATSGKTIMIFWFPLDRCRLIDEGER